MLASQRGLGLQPGNDGDALFHDTDQPLLYSRKQGGHISGAQYNPAGTESLSSFFFGGGWGLGGDHCALG